MSLDEFLPDYDANEVHSTHVAAPPEAAVAAARAVTSREVPLLVALMALRRLPAAILRRRRPTGRALDAPILEGMTRGGFVTLAERPDEVVLGVVGRFWTLDGGMVEVDAADFKGFDAPGYAKAVMDFRAEAEPGGARLTTETRIRCTDESSRRRFLRYWRVVMPGSAAIRRAWLRAIRLRAERG